jgi:hypothetical protein
MDMIGVHLPACWKMYTPARLSRPHDQPLSAQQPPAHGRAKDRPCHTDRLPIGSSHDLGRTGSSTGKAPWLLDAVVLVLEQVSHRS